MRTSLSLTLLLLLGTGCRDNAPFGDDAGVDGGMPDGSNPDGGRPDSGTDSGIIDETCGNPPLSAPTTGTCDVTVIGSGALLLRGDVVAPTGLLENGHVLIGSDGRIACAACDCSGAPGFDQATVVECAKGLIAPALVNPHEHISYAEGSPVSHGTERYDHRQEWRTGNGGTELRTPSGSDGMEPIWYAELRHLIAGTVSISGAAGAPGLLRNLDRNAMLQEGLNQAAVENQTFPLDDIRGTPVLASGCDYGSRRDSPTDSNIQNSVAYLPHISEGVNVESRNEFLCMSREENGGYDLVNGKTSIIHAIALLGVDYGNMGTDGASLVWSPRTNIDLYGETARVTTASRLGVNIAIGTDWPSSGSMNMLRELTCADELNQRNFGAYFSDRDLIDMATVRAARALGSEGKIGSLTPGAEADISIFDSSTKSKYRAIIDGEPSGVVLVMRSGLPVYGDQGLVDQLTDTNGCDTMSVCGVSKRVCVQRETGVTLSALQSAVRSGTIDLFYCGAPPNEPSCIPFRSMEYDGVPSAGDQDGDGIGDERDNCPTVFNPVRLVDVSGDQADDDGDMVGNACDPCPLTADSTDCIPPDTNDRDADMIPNAMDNCPELANMDQADGDNDGLGDVCDRCPNFSNPNDSACPARIYDVQQGFVTGAVLIENVLVTAVGSNGYYVQTIQGDPSFDATLREDYSGIFVFDRSDTFPARGDRLDIDGAVSAFSGALQISATTYTVLSSGNALPAPVVVTSAEVATGGTRARALLGVLVEARGVEVTDDNADDTPDMPDQDFGEFVVDGSLRVDDFLYMIDPRPLVGQTFGFLRGILNFSFNNSKLLPRDIEDVDVTPGLVGFDPASLFVPSGSSGVPPGGFAVVLSRTVSAATTITLASSSAQTTVPATVVVPMGSARVDVPITAGPASPTPVTITASLDGIDRQATVRIYDDAQARNIVSITLDNNAVTPNGSLGGTVVLDLPGASGGTTVNFNINPPALGTAASVTVPAGAFDARFTIQTGASLGQAMITADAGGATAQATFDVSNVVIGVPSAAGDFVISEFMKNPNTVQDDGGEWIEIYNPSPGTTYDLDGCVLTDLGTDTLAISGTVLVPAGGYATLARGPSPGFSPTYVYGPTTEFQLANGDDEIVITCGNVEIDAVVYTDAAFPDTPGAAANLSSDQLDGMANDDGANWCDADASYNGDFGTPGAPNRTCP